MGPAFATGHTAAAQEYHIPILYMKIIHPNHYRYECRVMAAPGSEEEAHRLEDAAQAAMEAAFARQNARWHGEHLPAISAHLDRLGSMNVQGRSAADIVSLLDEADVIHTDLWTIHFRVGFPMLMSIQIFDEFYTDVFAAEDADAHALLVGANSESVKAGIALSDLALSAKALGLEEVFEITPPTAMIPALEATAPGRVFLRQLHSFLETYGLRQDLFELTTPTWRENPSIALASVGSYLRTGYDARAAQISMIQAAERSLSSNYPQAVREQFEAMLQFARAGAFLQEEHNFYIDQKGTALLRLFYLKVSQHLVDLGLLQAPDDIFMLTIDEVRRIVMGDEKPGNVQQLVRQRQQEMEIAGSLVPPPFIGDPPAVSGAPGNVVDRTMAKFFGGAPQHSDNPGQLKGNPGSRGIATGIARVARSLDEAAHLQPGEILIATTTMPAWTPLFGVAAAVVTETGGSLSHCAIVAREYGIPAVVGAYGATQRITSGQEITVDGGLGIVTIA
jgi:pyruvate,water dikinase